MKKIKIKEITYEILEDHKEAFNLEEVESKYTDFFDIYDYILGDIMYGKLRLKGFCDLKNKKFNSINDFSKKDHYLKLNCPYVEKYFILKKVQD